MPAAYARVIEGHIDMPSRKVIRSLHKKCTNIFCNKFNSPQAVEGTYICIHCRKGTYRITAQEAKDSTDWSLLRQRQEFQVQSQLARAIQKDRLHQRRLDNDAMVERQKQEREQRKREETQRKQAEEEARKREADAREAEHQRAEAERKLREQQEIIRCHEAEVASMIKDVRTQDRRTKQNASPGNLERRKAHKRHVDSPPPGYAHHSARDLYYAHGQANMHNASASSSSHSFHHAYAQPSFSPYSPQTSYADTNARHTPPLQANRYYN